MGGKYTGGVHLLTKKKEPPTIKKGGKRHLLYKIVRGGGKITPDEKEGKKEDLRKALIQATIETKDRVEKTALVG